MLPTCFVFASFLGLLLVLLRAFRHFDRLVQIEHDSYHHRWLADGSPSGFFWKPPEASGQGSALARQRLSLTWVFTTPVWMANDSKAGETLKQMRSHVLAWNLGLLLWFLTFVLLG